MCIHLHPGSVLFVLLFFPLFIISCAVIGERPKGIALAGKKIVLDPGHGGEHLGAVGLNGLEEKVPNLEVSKHLKRMLEQDGAEVYLTRDRDDQTVTLEDRVAFAKEKKADLFVSLHHNANAQVDRAIDRSEIYYYWWHDGPSRDVANHLFAAFHRHLGLPQLPVRPAIYYVTRHNDPPCILGEPSYISNPEREAKLRTEEHHRQEAQAYYQAISEYFAAGIPRIEEFHINATVLETGLLELQAALRDEQGGSGIDPASIEVTLDEQPLPHHFDPRTGTLTATSPEPLPSGRHRLLLMARNRRGNAAKPVQHEFTVDLAPASLQLDCEPRWAPAKGTFAVRVWAILCDKNGHPVADGKTVSFVTDRGAPASSEGTTRGGQASTYLMLKEPRGKALIFATCENLYDRVEVQFDTTSSSLVTGTITNAMHSRPVAGAWVQLDERLVHADGEGHYLLEGVGPGPHQMEVTCPGYHRHASQIRVRKNAGSQEDVALEPLYQGLLLDTAVAIDAEAGGEDPGAVGPGGTKAADVNLRVALYLRDYLQAAGASVHLTRTEYHQTMDPVARTRLIHQMKPDKLISISHHNRYLEQDGSRCFYFYTDQEGKALAERIQKHLVCDLGRPDLGVQEWSSYLMIEALADRALVMPAAITDPAAEELLKNSASLRREAYAIFCGLLEDLGLDTGSTGVVCGTITNESGRPVEGALVVLDDALALETGTDGTYRFTCVSPGSRSLAVYQDGYESSRTTAKVSSQAEIIADIRLAVRQPS